MKKKMLFNKSEDHQHFGLRKLTVGVASVLLGTTFMVYGGQTVHAADNGVNGGLDNKTEEVSKDGDANKPADETATPVQKSQANQPTQASQASQASDVKKEAQPAKPAAEVAQPSEPVQKSQASEVSQPTQAKKADPAEKIAKEAPKAADVKDQPTQASQATNLVAKNVENAVKDQQAVKQNVETASLDLTKQKKGAVSAKALMESKAALPAGVTADKIKDDIYLNQNDLSDAQLSALGLDRDTYIVNGIKYHIGATASITDESNNYVLPETKFHAIHNADGSFQNLYSKLPEAAMNLVNDLSLSAANYSINYLYVYTPVIQGKTIYVHQGHELNKIDALNGVDQSQVDAFKDVDWDQAFAQQNPVDVNTPGTYKGSVDITYKNKTGVSAGVNIVVVGPKGIPSVTVNQGDPAPTADSIITNNDEVQKYFNGTTYSWLKNPSTEVAGSFPSVVVANWPDGSQTPVNTTVIVKATTKTKDENATVTRTIVDNVPGQNPIKTTQSVSFTRTVTTDFNGKQISATDWKAVGSDQWDAYTAKGAEGYTPSVKTVSAQTVTGDTKDVTVNITYTADARNQKVNYVEQGTSNVVSTQNVAGHTNETVGFTTQVPKNWVIVEGQNIPTQIQFGTKDPNPLNIYVKHGTKEVTDDTSKDVTRTVSFKNPINGTESVITVQRAHLTRTGSQDLVTGKITYTDWTTQHFEGVTAPNFTGYTVANPDAAPAITVDGNTESSKVVFTYNANDQKQNINYVNVTDGSTVRTDTVNGKTGSTVQYTGNVPENWELVPGQSIPTSITFGNSDNSPINVYVQHKTANVDDDTTKKTITRTVNYINPVTGATENIANQSVTLHRSGVKDLVTNKVTYGQWNTGNFEAVSPKEIEGYTVVNPYDAPSMMVTADTQNSTVTFKYTAGYHNQVINYVDSNNHSDVVKVDYVSGQTGSTVQYSPKAPINWKIVEGQDLPTSITFGTKDGAPKVIYVEHNKTEIPYNTTETVRRSIYANVEGQGRRYVSTQTVQLTRTATQDMVTGEITYGKWNTGKLDQFNAPTIPGYKVTNPDAAPTVVVDGSKTQLDDVVFNYVANEQQQKVNYVNAKDHSEIVYSDVVKGQVGTTVQYNAENHVPNGWVIVSGQQVPTSFTFGDKEADASIIYIDHGTKQTAPQTSTVTRDVVYINPTTSEEVTIAHQTSTFTRTGVTDLVTGKTTYPDWKSTTFQGVTAPNIPGYTVTNPDAAPSITVNGDSQSTKVIFNYTANKQNQVINYVDHSTGSVVNTTNVSGKTNETVSVDVNAGVPSGWVIVPGQEVPTRITFGSTSSQPINIQIEHGTKQADTQNRTVTRTVVYVNPQTGERTTITTQRADFTRTGVTDLVTGKTTYPDWKSTTFQNVTAPNIPGYTVTNPDAAPSITVNGDSESSTVVFNYTANKQNQVINYVDHSTGSVVNTTTINGTTGQTVNVDVNAGVPSGWVIVGGQEIPTQITFGSTSGQPINVQIEHGTKQTAPQTSTVTRDVVYVNPTTGQEVSVAHQTSTFTRTGVTDLVTGKTTYPDWKSTTFQGVTAPNIPGYTVTNPDAAPSIVVNGDSQSTKVVFNYTANDQNQHINYVDNTTGSIVNTTTVTGKTGQTVNVNVNTGVPSGWVIVPGQEVPTQITFGSTSGQDINIQIEHGTKQADTQNRTVTRTVVYVNPQTGERTTITTQRADFTRTGVTDLVTGKTTYPDWKSTTFQGVNAPNIPGYTVTNPDAAPSITVNGDSESSTVVFNYTANKQNQVINYVDHSTGSVVNTTTINGTTGQTVNIDVNSGVPSGWVIVGGQEVPTQLTFGSTSGQPINIQIEHGTKQAETQNRTVTRTVVVVNPQTGARQTVTVQTANFTRTGVTDLVTGKTTYPDWKSQTFQSVTAPNLPGYTVTNPDAAPTIVVNGDSQSSTVEFHYTANDQNQHIIYVDGNGTTVNTTTVTGKTGQTVNVDVNTGVPSGWVIVSGQEVPTQITFGSTPGQDITIHIEHGTKQTAPQTNTVTRDVVYVNPTTGQEVTVAHQTSTFTRTGVTDLVTGKTTYPDWKSTTFQGVNAPNIPGYTVTNPDAAPSIVVNGDSQSTKVVFNYTANDQTQHINYVDNNTGSIVNTTTVTGKTGQTVNVDVNTGLPSGWVIVPGQQVPTSITFGSTSGQDINIQIEHGTKQADTQNRTVTRTIVYVNPQTGARQTITVQSANFTRTGVTDLVTGKTTYPDWKSTTFQGVTAPNLPGYTVTNPDAAPSITVNGDSQSSTVEFHYTANDHSQKINYVDNNSGSVINTTNVTGKTGQTVNININSGIPSGWELVPGQQVPTSVTFGSDNPSDVNVMIQHGHKDITDSSYTTKQVTRDIYTNVPGQGKQLNGHQTATVIRKVTQDLVTGEYTYGNWTPVTMQQVSAPTVPGYTVTNPDAGFAVTVDGSQDKLADVVFNYTANEQNVHVNYVDQATNQSVANVTVTGKTGSTVNFDAQSYLPTGYTIVSGQQVPTSFTFGNSQMSDVTIYVRHDDSAAYKVSANGQVETHVGATANVPSLRANGVQLSWTDANGNAVAAPAGVQVAWGTLPDTSVASTNAHGILNITFADGTSTTVNVPAVVKGAVAGPIQTVMQNAAAPAAQLTVNTSNVDGFGIASVTWATEPSTAVAGPNVPGVARVNFSDGTYQDVNVTINVLKVDDGSKTRINGSDVYMELRGKVGQVSAQGQTGFINAILEFARTKVTNLALPESDPQRVTYTAWKEIGYRPIDA